MTATIYDDGVGRYVIKCKHPKFKEKWNCNGQLIINHDQLFNTMIELTDWANNETNDGMSFDVE